MVVFDLALATSVWHKFMQATGFRLMVGNNSIKLLQSVRGVHEPPPHSRLQILRVGSSDAHVRAVLVAHIN